MTKSDAKELFGGVTRLAKALGISRQYFYQWPDPMTQPQEDRVRGAYMRIAEERDNRVKAVLGIGQK